MKLSVAVVLSAMLLSSVALLNGYPLVYSDTGTYLTQALELEGAVDRPPYYSLLIFPFHMGKSLWLIPFFQGVLTAYLLLKVIQCFTINISSKSLILIVLILTLTSSLPWFTSQIMPDIFAGLVVLIVFVMVIHKSLPRAERWFLCLLLCAGITVHFTHVALTVSALFTLFLVGIFNSNVLPRKRVVVEIAACIIVALSAFVAYNYALLRMPITSAMGPIFLLARSLEDGPAREYLKTTCPDDRFVLCKKMNQIPATSDEIIWKADSPIQDLYREKKWPDVLQEAQLIVREAFFKYPIWQLKASAKNFFQQLTMIDTGDFNFDYLSPGSKVTRVIKEHFPGEYEQYSSSMQVQKKFPLSVIATFHIWMAVLSLVGSLVLVFQKRRGTCFIALFSVITFAIVVNAFVTGVFSAPLNRYGSRMIWLYPFIFVVGLREYFLRKKDAGAC